MIKIKFNNENIFHEVEFIKTDNRIILKGITEPNTSGFCTYRMSGEQLGDFSDFNTVFKAENDSVTYSNDGSVYAEPQPYEPTVEDKINALKKELESTDYQAIKYAEGWFTEEDYAPIKAKREDLREKIRELGNELK